MHTAINPNELLTALNPVEQLVEEAKIHINPDGIATRAVDPANVGMVEMTIETSAFDEFNVDEAVTLGVNIDTLIQQVQDISNEPGVDAEEVTLHLSLDEDQGRLHLSTDIGSMDFTLGLIDPESIREEPDIPELDLTTMVNMDEDYLTHLIKTANNYSNHIVIRSSDDHVEMEASGDTDAWDATLTDDLPNVHGTVYGDDEAIFSLEYLTDMVKGIPNRSEVMLRAGNEYPMEITFDTMDGHAAVRYMLAPRIQSD